MDKEQLLKRVDELKRNIEMGAGQLNQMIGRLHEIEDVLKFFESKMSGAQSDVANNVKTMD